MNFENYNIIDGNTYNINNFINAASSFLPLDNYGANTTVTYCGFNYKNLTQFSGGIPYIEKITKDDFILFEFKIGSKEEMSKYTLFNFHNYAFDITLPDSEPIRVFGSVDTGIQFFDKIKKYNSVVKICITSSKNIARFYENQGYIISKVPLELLQISTFNWLIRVGVLEGTTIAPNLRDLVTSFYYSYKGNPDNNTNVNDYFNSTEVINSFPKTYLPVENDIYKFVQKKFYSLKNKLINNPKVVLKSPFYPYLSNFVNTKYAMENVFDALSVNPPAQIQANDTGKSYYLTNYINFSDYPDGYVYIIALNHNASNVSLSSNIQIYESPTFKAIANGTTYTGPNDSSILNTTYPIESIENSNQPLFNIVCYSCKNLIKSGVKNEVVICERLQYSMKEPWFHPSSNIYPGTGYVLILKKPLTDEIELLKKEYNININYVSVPYE